MAVSLNKCNLIIAALALPPFPTQCCLCAHTESTPHVLIAFGKLAGLLLKFTLVCVSSQIDSSIPHSTVKPRERAVGSVVPSLAHTRGKQVPAQTSHLNNNWLARSLTLDLEVGREVEWRELQIRGLSA